MQSPASFLIHDRLIYLATISLWLDVPIDKQTLSETSVKNILVLGGYGNFGKRIVSNLSSIAGIRIIVAGRSLKNASMLVQELLESSDVKATLEAAVIDINAGDFPSQLLSMAPNLVIHTGGPFQNQDYSVPKACIAASCHYIDLADDRRFVCDITSLNAEALNNNVLVVSGASTVPGLSSTVIDHYKGQFSKINEIDFSIAPGNQAERGEATVRGILSYTGHAFKVYKNGQWVNQYGWMSPRKLYFNKEIGHRCLANIDIPDLELFPKRYPDVKTVNFQAGLELPFLHYGMVLMAFMAKIKLVKDWSILTKPIFKASEILKYLGTDIGGMQIKLNGTDTENNPKKIKWVLSANGGIGPYIPTLSAIIIAKKLIAGELTLTGATPCLGLYTLEEFDHEAFKLGIYHQVEGISG